MDPCPYVRITVSNLNLPQPAPATGNLRPRFCLLKVHHLPQLFSALPFHPSPSCSTTLHLNASDLHRLSSKPTPSLTISVFSHSSSSPSCGSGLFSIRASAKMLGKARVPLDLQAIIESNSNRASVLYSGWVSLGNKRDSKKEDKERKLHLVIKAEPDPRVFEFEGEPECSPRVVQVQGRVKQPVFTCKFSLRSTAADRNVRPRVELRPELAELIRQRAREVREGTEGLVPDGA